jgi:hypothetical protein
MDGRAENERNRFEVSLKASDARRRQRVEKAIAGLCVHWTPHWRSPPAEPSLHDQLAVAWPSSL